MTGHIAFVPYGTKFGMHLADVPLSKLNWPLGKPDDLGGTVRDLGAEDDVIVYPSSAALYAPRRGVRCRVSIVLAEPPAFHGRYYRAMSLLSWRYHRILTFSPDLLARLNNAVFLPFGTTWVADWRSLDLTKTADLSLIASAKKKLAGHRLRHRIVALCREKDIDIAVMGGGYAPFERKSDGLAAYRYSVAIENSREPSYFTEKLIDCFMCDTVPIYWGAPDIEQYFDPKGMIICRTEAEIMAAIDNISEADYLSRLQFVRANREAAAIYLDYEKNACEKLAASTGHDR